LLSLAVTAGNVHEKHALPHLLPGCEQHVYDDNAYASQKELIRSKAPPAKDFTNERVRRRKDEPADEGKREEPQQVKIRARVEQVFTVVKRLLEFTKVRYHGLAKKPVVPLRHWCWPISTCPVIV
jgi:IS5 family transposase